MPLNPDKITEAQASSSPARRVLFGVLSILVIPVLLLGLLEGGLRVLGYGVAPDFFVPIEEQRAFTTNPNFARQFFPPALARLPQPIRVPFDKPDDVTRIVVIGGSAAMGEPEPTFSFSRVLDVMLARLYPDRKFEVINTGMATINSHVVRLIADELPKIEPDIVLIYVGNNEVVGPFGAGTVFGSYSPSLALIRLGIELRSYRIGQLIDGLVRWVGADAQYVAEGQGMAVFRDQYVHASDQRLQKVRDHFRENLTAIVSGLRNDGVQVVLSTVGANLADHAPFASVFGDGPSMSGSITEPGIRVGMGNPTVRSGSPIVWGQLFAEGVAFSDRGDFENAIRSLEAANQIDPAHAELHFRLGHLYERTGDLERARKHWVLARDYDALRFRVDSALNQVICDVAGASTARLVSSDLALAEADRSGRGVPGSDVFHEHVHLTFQGNFTVAAAMSKAVVELAGEPTGSLPTKTQCADDLALTDFDRYRLFASVAGLMRRAPFTNQYDFRERRRRTHEQINKLRVVGTSGDGMARATRIYRRALSVRPTDTAVRQNYAQFLQESGSLLEATEEWKRLLESNPNVPTWRLALATALSDQGAHQAAFHEYVALKTLMPGLVLPHIQIGYELVASGQIGEAVHVLFEALSINPGSIVARLNLVSLLEDVDQSAVADEVVEAGLALVRGRGDEHAEADLLVGRSDLLVRRDVFDDAIADLEDAFSLYRVTRDLESEGSTLLSLGRAERERQNLESAARRIAEGRAFAAEYQMRELEAQFVMQSALIAMDTDNQAKAGPLVKEARAIYASLSDRHPGLERLDRLLEILPSNSRF